MSKTELSLLANSSLSSLVSYDSSKVIDKEPKLCSLIPGELINFDVNKKPSDSVVSQAKTPPVCTELIDSSEWIKKYGLKQNKLTFQDILSMIGFKQSQDYMEQFRKIVSARYSAGLHLQIESTDGKVYNITAGREQIVDYIKRLQEAIKLFKHRLQWLTSDSRRIFGVVTEKSICLVLDCKNKDPSQFKIYKSSVIKLLNEQVSKIISFNIIRCSDRIEMFKNKVSIVSKQSIDEAIEWLNDWNKLFVKTCTDTTTCEAVLLGFLDNNIEAVYLISEGTSSNGTRELLYDKVLKNSLEKKIRLNIVSYNCVDPGTNEFLRRVATSSFNKGKFHAYCLLREFEDYTSGPIESEPTKLNVQVNKRLFGGAPPGSSVKAEIMLVYEEIQTANQILENLSAVLHKMIRDFEGEPDQVKTQVTSRKILSKEKITEDEYLTSAEWLKKNGLRYKKLEIFDVLNKVCFKHCDGVVTLQKEPAEGGKAYVVNGTVYYQGDSVVSEKLINAQYCDQFAHVLWNDGTLRHVHVTSDLQRTYEEKVRALLEQYERRIDWLSRGSRELFGTVIETNICVLIDTSQSMQLSLDFVKRKLVTLIQEQLRTKQRFNLVAFNTRIIPWRDRSVEVDEFNMKSAMEWIASLTAQGSTNTLNAIKFALADMNVEAIYMLTDGRPDQVHLNTRIPIHVISFNCNDSEANKFLSQLARETKGRYHYFNEHGWDADPEGPVPYQSEDISLLKEEIQKGLKYIGQMAALREECAKLSGSSKKSLATRQPILKRRTQGAPNRSATSSQTPFLTKYESKDLYNLSKSVDTFNESVLNTLYNIKTLDWMLPETRELLEKQYRKQNSDPNSLVKKEDKEAKSTEEDQDQLTSRAPSAPRIRKWLKKNSLSALRLVIFDKLIETVSNSSKSPKSQLKEEFASSDAWKQVIDLARDTDYQNIARLKHFNPLRLDLDSYERKLQGQIEVYKKHLADEIWLALPDVEKTLLDFKRPTEFNEDNRDALIKSITYSNCPGITKKDVLQVEDEIRLAELYLNCSRKLNIHLKQLPIDSILEEQVDKPNTEKVLSSVIDSEMKRAINSEQKLTKGDKVIARNDMLGYFYPGKLLHIKDLKHVDVKFDKGFSQTDMPVRNVIKLNSAMSTFISNGDYVLAKCINEFDEPCYVPGIVQAINHMSPSKQHIILYFNGQEGMNTRSQLVKINKTMYSLAVNYIRSRLGLNTNVKASEDLEGEDQDDNIEWKKPAPMSTITQTHIDELKHELLDEIRYQFDSLKFDEKYQKMYKELSELKKKQKGLKASMNEKLGSLKDDFEEFKKQPPVVLPDPNHIIYVEGDDEKKDKIKVKKSKRHNSESLDQTPRSNKSSVKSEDTIASLRKRLPELKEGEEVLARWNDDGWYYRSLVKRNLGEYKYLVEDALKEREEIYREDIIAERDSDFSFKVDDPVIALHPEYEYSYAPGHVIRISDDGNKIHVRFYDFVESVVLRQEAYKTAKVKLQADIDEIIKLEERWVGETVVARNTFSNLYELGRIKNRVKGGLGRMYTIEWSSGKQSIQNSTHIFGKYTRNPAILRNDFVLAPKETIFMPGRVLGVKGNQLSVKFVDGELDENINYDDCYWISRDYYEDACNFYKRRLDTYDSESTSTARSQHSNRYNVPIIDAKDFYSGRSSRRRDSDSD